MSSKTLYDVSEAGYQLWCLPVFGLVCVAIGVAGLRYKFLWARHGLLCLLFMVCWLGLVFVGTYSDYRGLAAALHESRCEVVEGPLTQLQITWSTTAHFSESFVVAGRRFECLNYVMTAGYTPTRGDGAPLRESMPVRIFHLHGEIARFEIEVPDL